MNTTLVVLFLSPNIEKSVVGKYVSIYNQLSYEVEVYPVSREDLLSKKSALKNSYNFLNELENKLENCPKKLAVHCVSTGCYFYSLMIYILNENPVKFSTLTKSLTYQIIDSPGIFSIDNFVSKSLEPYVESYNESSLGKIITNISENAYVDLIKNIFFATTGIFTGPLFRKGKKALKFVENPYTSIMKYFKQNLPIVKTLLIKTETDETITTAEFNKIANRLKQKKNTVEIKIFQNCDPGLIFQTHASEYQKVVEHFFKQLQSKL